MYASDSCAKSALVCGGMRDACGRNVSDDTDALDSEKRGNILLLLLLLLLPYSMLVSSSSSSPAKAEAMEGA
jgi:hypothetical protein